MPQVRSPIDKRQPETLNAGDVDGFLAYLFSDLGGRPEKLLLRESAAVAKYLQRLGRDGIPLAVLKRGATAIEEYRQAQPGNTNIIRAKLEVQDAADVVWGAVLQYGEFAPAIKSATLRFLTRHADTYCRLPHLKSVLEFVRTHEIPADLETALSRRPTLMSRHMSTSWAPPDFRDDLSDRIFAAYYALPRAGVKKRSPTIAAALSASDKTGKGTEWGWEEVNERVKAFTKGQKRRLIKLGATGDKLTSRFEQFKNGRADFWISSFKFNRSCQELFRSEEKPLC
jgi:hypothetical protein